jgi:hypothetical protein
VEAGNQELDPADIVIGVAADDDLAVGLDGYAIFIDIPVLADDSGRTKTGEGCVQVAGGRPAQT